MDCIGHASRRTQLKRLIQDSKSLALLKMYKTLPNNYITISKSMLNVSGGSCCHAILAKVWKMSVKLNKKKGTGNFQKQAIILVIFHANLSYILWQGLNRDVH